MTSVTFHFPTLNPKYSPVASPYQRACTLAVSCLHLEMGGSAPRCGGPKPTTQNMGLGTWSCVGYHLCFFAESVSWRCVSGKRQMPSIRVEA